MRATTIREKLSEEAERSSWVARTGALALVLAAALGAHHLTTTLTAEEPAPLPANAASLYGADGGSPRYVEMPHLELPWSVPDRVSVDRSDRPDDGIGAAAVAMGPTLPSAHGIPATVLAAYRDASDRLDSERPDCGVSVPLLAAIGRVESNHARGGNVDASGTTRAPIIGLQLNGGPGVATIRDTDGGRYDGDAVFDRAVGPMQFIPSTWSRWGTDGSGDGVADPHNVYDATLAAGRYLCAAGGDLSTQDGRRRAVLAYNHSEHYLSVVLSWMSVYSGGAMAVPDGYSAGTGDIRAVSMSGSAKKGSSTTGSSKAGSSDSSGKTSPSPKPSSEPDPAEDQPPPPPKPAPEPEPKPEPKPAPKDDEKPPADDKPSDRPVTVPEEAPVDVPDEVDEVEELTGDVPELP